MHWRSVTRIVAHKLGQNLDFCLATADCDKLKTLLQQWDVLPDIYFSGLPLYYKSDQIKF